MKILIQNLKSSYQLLDSGDGYKLERYGNNIIMRSDSNCVWNKKLNKKEWGRADAIFQDGKWLTKPNFAQPWVFEHEMLQRDCVRSNKIICKLRFSSSKNIGIFPEQEANWSWFMPLIKKSKRPPRVLNLFGYTGMASLCAAAAGADVCHVDASKAAVNWAKSNQVLSKMDKLPIRWIVDDCMKFVAREVKRGAKYEAIILDPPAFGKGTGGKVFKFQKDVGRLLSSCKKILSSQPLFFIFNGYSIGYSATVLKNLLNDFFPEFNIEFGELQLQEDNKGRNLPCSLFARFKGR